MDVKTAIESRRAYRALQKIEITQNMINSLGTAVSLTPSCFNSQPWRFVFVYEEKMLKSIITTLSNSNQTWASTASMIIVAFARKEDDCVIKKEDSERAYYLFDLGQSVAYLCLQATELGLVAHPIAGYDPKLVHEILAIPPSYSVINLIIIGKKDVTNEKLSEKQRKTELERPARLPMNKIVFHNQFMEN